MLGLFKNQNKVPHRGAGVLLTFSSVFAGLNSVAAESTGNTTLDTLRYGASALLLGGMGVVSFLKVGRNFEATMPPSQELPAAQEPKAPNRSRGSGPLFVTSAIAAVANLGAVETVNNISVDSIRNGATALLLGGMAATSLVNRLRDVKAPALKAAPAPELPPESSDTEQPPESSTAEESSTVEQRQEEKPAYQFAKVGAPVAEFPSLAEERLIPGRLGPVIMRGA